MDHIPVASSGLSRLEVPYYVDELCPFIYDNQPWIEYPQRVNWDLETLHDADFTNRGRNTTNQASAFLQAWLYFGMMHAVTGIPVTTTDFVRTNENGQYIITTDSLPLYLSRWRESVSPLSEVEKRDLATATDAMVKTLTETLILYIGWRTPLSNEVVLSIIILHKTLMCAKRSTLTASDYEPSMNYYQESREVIDTRLYEMGWCKRDVAKHHQAHSCLSTYFAISLGPRLLIRDHTNCSITDCFALQIDESTFVTKHTTVNCDCNHVRVDLEKISSTIESGATPLVRLSQMAVAPRLDVITGCDYVCITHVWADGLGNPQDNSLPLCQLNRLQDQINALYPDRTGKENIPFWIDSLCIPVMPERITTRKRAIASMARVYAEAAKVLVLDAELQMASCHVSDEEIALRISYSVWWSRLWTLQEGIFAKELWFQFCDGLQNGKELIRRSDSSRELSSITAWRVSDEICYEGLGYLRELYSFKSEPTARRVEFILQAVNWRSSSKRSDEPICLGTLFNLNVETLINTPKEDRLKKFILMQQVFPSVTLFFSGAKMDEDGFRWAPKSFIFSRSSLLPAYQKNPHRGGSRFDRQNMLARADEFGLHAEYFGLRLESLEGCSSVEGQILLRDDDTEFWYTFRPMRTTITTPFMDLELHQISNLAIVLPVRPSDNVVYYGVLVSVYKEENGVLLSRFVSRVSIHEWGKRSSMSIRILLGVDEPRPAKAKRLSGEQKWCIG